MNERSTPNPQRIDDVLAAVRQAWIPAPHLRFGQLVTEAEAVGGLHMLGSEDDAWQHAFDTQAQKHHELLEKRLSAATGGMSPDERNFIAGALFGVYRAASTRMQPFVTLIRWQVLETKTGAHHLIGQSVQDRDGRVSTRVAHWDPATRTAVTQSGRYYHLDGLPSRDEDAFHVFETWAGPNGIDSAACTNVSIEYAPGAINPEAVIQVPAESLRNYSVHVAAPEHVDVRLADWVLLYADNQLKPVCAVVVSPTDNDNVWVVNPRPWHTVGFTGDAFWDWWNRRIIETGVRDRLCASDNNAIREMFLLCGVTANVTYKDSEKSVPNNDDTEQAPARSSDVTPA